MYVGRIDMLLYIILITFIKFFYNLKSILKLVTKYMPKLRKKTHWIFCQQIGRMVFTEEVFAKFQYHFSNCGFF